MNLLRERLVAAAFACSLVFAFICGFRWPLVHMIMAGLLVAMVAAMAIQFLTDEDETARRRFQSEHQGIMQ